MAICPHCGVEVVVRFNTEAGRMQSFDAEPNQGGTTVLLGIGQVYEFETVAEARAAYPHELLYQRHRCHPVMPSYRRPEAGQLRIPEGD